MAAQGGHDPTPAALPWVATQGRASLSERSMITRGPTTRVGFSPPSQARHSPRQQSATNPASRYGPPARCQASLDPECPDKHPQADRSFPATCSQLGNTAQGRRKVMFRRASRRRLLRPLRPGRTQHRRRQCVAEAGIQFRRHLRPVPAPPQFRGRSRRSRPIAGACECGGSRKRTSGRRRPRRRDAASFDAPALEAAAPAAALRGKGRRRPPARFPPRFPPAGGSSSLPHPHPARA